MYTTINEFKLNESSTVKVVAKSRIHLKELVEANIKHFGVNCDLNYIDVSGITEMKYVFFESPFNGNISEWDVSNVTDMLGMFQGSQFNGDISNWNVSNVKNMTMMFENSTFNQDLSNWNVLSIVTVNWMFDETELMKNDNLPDWYNRNKLL